MDIGLGIVGHLVFLVENSVLGSGGSATQAGVAVLGDTLVGLLRSCGTSALDGLRDVLAGVLDSVLGNMLVLGGVEN